MKQHLYGSLLLALLITACAPQTQGSKPSAAPQTQSSDMTQPNPQLLGNTLNVPDTTGTVVVDAPSIQGELTPFEVDGDKGTVRLLSQGVSVSRSEGRFLVLPVEVLRVSGAGGLYLLLLEQTGATFVQRDAQALGQRVSLLSLEHEGNLITATTVDSRLGKAPDFEVSRGGVMRFRLQGERLERVSE